MTLMTNDGYFCLIKEFRKHTEDFFFYIPYRSKTFLIEGERQVTNQSFVALYSVEKNGRCLIFSNFLM